MINAVYDKVVVELLKVNKTKGGIILPDNAREPQGYGKVVSVGDKVENIEKGDIIVFFIQAGMDMLIDKTIMKTLKYEEVYGVLIDEATKETLEPFVIGGQSPLIQSV